MFDDEMDEKKECQSLIYENRGWVGYRRRPGFYD